MLIERVPVGALETNCYIVSSGKGAKQVCLIDPGDEADKIKRAVGQRTVEAIYLTHGHYDHTGALAGFAGVPIYIHEKDAPMLKNNRLSAGYLADDDAERPDATNYYAEGEALHHAGLRLTVMETPGHTPGGVCLMADKVIFTGDTLFRGDYGRTDLPGGSSMQMRQSLRRLFQLKGMAAYPGHGEDTVI